MTADTIKALLATKHLDDVYVEECKDGPSSLGPSFRFDAWAMARSYVHPHMTGYEIKVSRQDFLTDTKWHNYLELCNSFYLVSPRGIIGLEEVPVEAGLMWVASTGTRLYTKKKAPYRNIDTPVLLLLYILMSRSKVVSPQERFRIPDLEFWRHWLHSKDQRLELGHHVSRRLQERIQTEIDVVQHDNNALRRRIQMCEATEEFLAALGITTQDVYWLKVRLREELETVIPKEIRHGLVRARNALGNVLATMDELDKKAIPEGLR